MNNPIAEIMDTFFNGRAALKDTDHGGRGMRRHDPIKCVGCGAPIFVRSNGTIVAHYASMGNRCLTSETLSAVCCEKGRFGDGHECMKSPGSESGVNWRELIRRKTSHVLVNGKTYRVTVEPVELREVEP